MPEKGFVLPRFVIQALGGRALTVYGDGSQRRAFAHVSDVARGIVAVAEARQNHDDVWNIGHPGNCITVRALAEMVLKKIGRGTITCCDPRQLHGPWFAECEEKLPDISRARSLLGWEPVIPLDAIVEEAIAFWADGERYREYMHLV
jgi:nucleoside-diphosphate-sugar epimerase